MKKYVTTRKVYKAVKKYDHQQFDDFCTRVYMNGYEDGKKAVPGVDVEEILKAVSDVRGVGPALAGKIKAAVNDLFQKSEVKENEK
ncbi:hypothetical protein B5E53_06965 [Eubacterium sp. An11]|uniref:hypothetical protein n=1 Tax=Eubacterium sp. An11 TaxID=1965542 RepID=UPI000B37FCC0|nr:hypothetical protein [Eubacterium sp. An11]OUQ68201.1 hypothetical protein B5E53_06965 [Eubacterium sp. An11]